MENGNLEVGQDQLYFRIGQVCRLTDIKPFTLRYWESEFPTLAPVKSSKGHRLYRREDVQTVLRIKRLLYDEGFTIAGARRYLRDADPGAAPGEAPPQPHMECAEKKHAATPETGEEVGEQVERDPGRLQRRDEVSAGRAEARSVPMTDAAAASAGSPVASTPLVSAPSISTGSAAHAERPRAHAEAGSIATTDASAPPSTDAANMLTRKLLLDLRDSLRAFLTLLENE